MSRSSGAGSSTTVADSLRALDHDATGLKAQTDAWRSASDSLDLTRGQYRVGGVSYAGLPGHPSFPLVQKYLPRGAGAVLTFELRGGRAAGGARRTSCSWPPSPASPSTCWPPPRTSCTSSTASPPTSALAPVARP